MVRYVNSFKLVAAVALLNGCGGSPQDLIPQKGAQLNQVPDDGLATVKQEIASLGFSTYLGFGGEEQGTAIAADSAGNSYITGTTTTFGGTTNIFVSKLSPTGSMVYYTYFPGTQATGIAVDSGGNAYVVGMTAAGPTLTKVDPAGSSMVYQVSLGWDTVTGVKVDATGNAYVVGSINMGGLSGMDVVVGKVDPIATAFLYHQTFGGTGDDAGNGIAIDSGGNAYIVGTTKSTNFPVASAFQTVLKGSQDAFVAKLNPTATSLLFSTYLGGNYTDSGAAITLDGFNSVYVTGTTDAFNGVQNFPVTSGMVQSTPGGGGDAFVVKFSSGGSRTWATYVGGNAPDSGASIAVNGSNVYVTGATVSTNFPTTNLAFQRFVQPGMNAFVAQFSTNGGTTYTYSTYLGGNSTDKGAGIAVNSTGIYVTGNTNSTNFPTNVYGAGGGTDAFVTKFNGP